jgi:DNA-binding transcriptional LysR family regulator
MEMHQIRYFLAVSEFLNFRRAAEKCHVSPSALTRAIQKLEDEVGGRLFRRERNLTHLTDLGILIRPHSFARFKGYPWQSARLQKEA